MNQQIHIRIAPEIHRKMKALAVVNGRSMNDVAVDIISAHLSQIDVVLVKKEGGNEARSKLTA